MASQARRPPGLGVNFCERMYVAGGRASKAMRSRAGAGERMCKRSQDGLEARYDTRAGSLCYLAGINNMAKQKDNFEQQLELWRIDRATFTTKIGITCSSACSCSQETA